MAGLHHTCALSAFGTVTCWGANTAEQTTVPSDLAAATRLCAGGNSTLTINADDQALTARGPNDDVPPG
eukprot:8662275-Prorocentrum_lima.AAC.1